jgi:hypothetical protein
MSWEVELDPPVTRAEWCDRPSNFSPNGLVELVRVAKQVQELVPDQLIEAR